MPCEPKDPDSVDLAGLAAKATHDAYLRAKAASQTVVVSKGGFIVEERPDGSEAILWISKRSKVQAGVTLNIRSMKPSSSDS